MDAIYNLSADMGGMGFIEGNKALCMLSVLINTHMLEAARKQGVGSFFYASSACVYPADRQASAEVEPLREADAYPADPGDGYGWEKLFGERMCRHFSEDFGLRTRVARYHNVYGPHGTYKRRPQQRQRDDPASAWAESRASRWPRLGEDLPLDPRPARLRGRAAGEKSGARLAPLAHNVSQHAVEALGEDLLREALLRVVLAGPAAPVELGGIRQGCRRRRRK
jgi:hypothetical protein